jgi:hypothetical protein
VGGLSKNNCTAAAVLGYVGGATEQAKRQMMCTLELTAACPRCIPIDHHPPSESPTPSAISSIYDLDLLPRNAENLSPTHPLPDGEQGQLGLTFVHASGDRLTAPEFLTP